MSRETDIREAVQLADEAERLHHYQTAFAFLAIAEALIEGRDQDLPALIVKARMANIQENLQKGDHQ